MKYNNSLTIISTLILFSSVYLLWHFYLDFRGTIKGTKELNFSIDQKFDFRCSISLETL